MKASVVSGHLLFAHRPSLWPHAIAILLGEMPPDPTTTRARQCHPTTAAHQWRIPMHRLSYCSISASGVVIHLCPCQQRKY